MFKLIRSQPQTALWVLGIPALVMLAYILLVVNYSLDYNNGATGALLDDTWIHIRFAESISEGRGLMYNPGVVTSGATSPLWVLSLGAVFAIFDPGISQQLNIALTMSAISGVLMVMAISGVTWDALRKPWAGLLAGCITALTGRMIWVALSGMEITTFTLLLVLALWSHMADVRGGVTFGWRTGILAALTTLGRPEGYLLAAVIGLDAFVLLPLFQERIPWRDLFRRVRDGWRGIVAYLLLAGSYPLACLFMDGYPLPNTFRVKSSLGRETPDLFYGYFWTPRVDHGWLIILLAGAGLAALLWRQWRRKSEDAHQTGFALILWPVAFVVGVLFLGPQHFVVNNSRYVAPAIPFHALLAVAGLWLVADWLTRNTRNKRAIIAAVGVVLAGMTLWHGRSQGHGVANDVHQLRAMHVSAAEWVATVTEPGDLIALNDVGAIAHIADRPVLDTVGLVSPEVIEPLAPYPRHTCEHDVQLMRIMMAEQPRLIGVFPWWYPCMTNLDTQGFTDILQPFNVFSITGPTVLAGGEMVFYTPLWENWPLQVAIDPTATRIDQSFEDGFTLGAFEVQPGTDALDVTLWWTPYTEPSGDYTVFVHLLDADGEIVTQRDSRPRDGRFNTAWWHTGDIIPDRRTIPLTAAERDRVEALRIGLYPTAGGAPLTRLTAPPDEATFIIIPLNSVD